MVDANYSIIQIWQCGGTMVDANYSIIQIWQCGGTMVDANYLIIQIWQCGGTMVDANYLIIQIWQCGGTMVDAPCSRVGHIYRKYSPFGGAGKGDYLGKNYKRVAAVWMDEYAEYLYKNRPYYRLKIKNQV